MSNLDMGRNRGNSPLRGLNVMFFIHLHCRTETKTGLGTAKVAKGDYPSFIRYQVVVTEGNMQVSAAICIKKKKMG